MQNEILINAEAGETRVAILEKGSFVELHVERAGLRNHVGSIVRGRVTRVLPGMQAAFVDIGLEKAAFLYAGDYLREPNAAEVDLGDDEEAVRPRRGRRNGQGRGVPKIESLLREGEEILVQVAKEPIGTKGARITSHVAVPGRHLVLTPWSRRVGVSRRIESERERRRLREIVERLRPRDLGFIIRTAGDAAREPDLEADIRYLTSVWDDIQLRKEEVRAPELLYSEPALPLRVIRDFANPETKRIVVDSPEVHQTMVAFVERFVADPKPRIELHQGAESIFDRFGIESQIDANLGRKVWLKSGGYLIVDQSEALTAIDVNTGRYVGKRDLEETVLKTNLEAVREVVYQLRFRNIGGLIIIDLIDMETAENRDKVYRALQEALRQDKARTNLLKISELGLIEMTRKRTRDSLVRMLCEPCPYCEGSGYVASVQSVAFKILREMRADAPRFSGRRLALAVNPRVAELLLGPARDALESLQRELEREIEIRARPGLHQEQFELEALDAGPPVALELPWLSTTHPDVPARAPEPEAPEEQPEEKPAEEEPGEEEPGEEEPASEPLALDPEPAPLGVEDSALEDVRDSRPEGSTGADGDGRETAEAPGLIAGGEGAPLDEFSESRILRRSQEGEES